MQYMVKTIARSEALFLVRIVQRYSQCAAPACLGRRLVATHACAGLPIEGSPTPEQAGASRLMPRFSSNPRRGPAGWPLMGCTRGRFAKRDALFSALRLYTIRFDFGLVWWVGLAGTSR
jgi:hypothetical protein